MTQGVVSPVLRTPGLHPSWNHGAGRRSRGRLRFWALEGRSVERHTRLGALSPELYWVTSGSGHVARATSPRKCHELRLKDLPQEAGPLPWLLGRGARSAAAGVDWRRKSRNAASPSIGEGAVRLLLGPSWSCDAGVALGVNGVQRTDRRRLPERGPWSQVRRTGPRTPPLPTTTPRRRLRSAESPCPSAQTFAWPIPATAPSPDLALPPPTASAPAMRAGAVLSLRRLR